MIDKGIGNGVWDYNVSLIVNKIKGSFSIENISERSSEIDNKKTKKEFWDYNINCNADEIKGSFSIDNISNKFSGIVLFRINRLFIVLLGINIESIIIKGTLIISITDKDNGSLIISSVSVGNDHIWYRFSGISKVWLTGKAFDTYFPFSTISLFTLSMLLPFFNIDIIAGILSRVFAYVSKANRFFRNSDLSIIQFKGKSGVV